MPSGTGPDPHSGDASSSQPALQFDFDRISRLVARSLALTPPALAAAFRSAAAHDLEAIVEFRRTVLGAEVVWDDRRYLIWRYGLEGGRGCFARLFVLEVAGRVIACIGAEEFALSCARGRLAGACAIDIAVRPEHRLAGLGPWLTLALMRRYAVTLALSANEQSLGLVTKLYAPLPARTAYQIPIDLGAFLSRRLRGAVLTRAIAAPLGRLLALLLGGIVHARNRALIRRSRRVGLELRPVARFRREWDALLLASPRADVTHIERSAAYLNWRYLDNPRVAYRLIAAFRGEELAAYAVYRGSGAPSPGHGLDIADWWCAQSDPGALRALIALIVAEAMQGGYDVVGAAALGAAADATLRHAGFLARNQPGAVAGFACSDPGLAPAIANAGAWYLTGLGDDLDGL